MKDKARWETNGERKLGDKARWETNWETNWETSPARRTQHPTQGERQSQVGDKLGDRRQALRGGHSTPAKADTLKTALRTPTVNCLGNKTSKRVRVSSSASQFCVDVENLQSHQSEKQVEDFFETNHTQTQPNHSSGEPVMQEVGNLETEAVSSEFLPDRSLETNACMQADTCENLPESCEPVTCAEAEQEPKSLLSSLKSSVVIEVFCESARVTASLRTLGLSSSFGVDHVKANPQGPIKTVDLTTAKGQKILLKWLQSPLVAGVFLAPRCGTCSLSLYVDVLLFFLRVCHIFQTPIASVCLRPSCMSL